MYYRRNGIAPGGVVRGGEKEIRFRDNINPLAGMIQCVKEKKKRG